uniref:ABC transporter domain-containing protein n=1 Tax=Alexandrium monilatum TaxID=311494 RepID=A0A7S4QHI8_9DINO
MSRELRCGTGDQVMLEVQSGWLIDGAGVVIENLKAGYADIPRDVLKGISVSFEPRMKVSIAGTTGCGKSSLLLVLLRMLEPRAGRVLLNGVDTRDVGLVTLRRSLGLVPQDPVLFSGSLKYNLDPFGIYSDGRMWKALELAGMADVVRGWDSRLFHQISEEGTNLSFGQRQLICLARMVLRQPPLLLLDEATSAIDPRTQEEVQHTIITAFPNSTLIAVAHRLETVLDFDYVCVLERGEVVEQGAVKEVSQRKGGRFRAMLEAKKSW